ncbi:MAG TPA: prepilin peptidase [Methylophilus sp.]
MSQLWMQPLLLGLLITLGCAVVTDITARKIPNLLIVFGLVASLVCQLVLPDGIGFREWLLAVLLGLLCFLPLYLLRAMAAGDVKLMAVVGGFVGYPLVISAALYSFVAGGVMALVMVLLSGKAKALQQNLTLMLFFWAAKPTNTSSVTDAPIISVGKMPYAVAISLGGLLAWYMK